MHLSILMLRELFLFVCLLYKQNMTYVGHFSLQIEKSLKQHGSISLIALIIFWRLTAPDLPGSLMLVCPIDGPSRSGSRLKTVWPNAIMLHPSDEKRF